MNWQEVSVKTTPEAIEAVSDFFCLLGSGGVIIEDPDDLRRMAQSGQWDAFEFPEERVKRTDPVIKGYLPVNTELPGKLEELQAGLAEIASRLGQASYQTNAVTVCDEDWANSWKAYFKPVKISDRLVIRPTWEPYTAGEGEIVLDLDPGMAFGTGSHVTTVMCVRLLEKYIRPGHSVIDVGTGTGILAMGAACLGAGEVLAVDNDPVAVKAARENIELNHLADKVRVETNDLLRGLDLSADLITANIIADIIIKLLPQAKAGLSSDGILIASGIIAGRKNDVATVARAWGFVLEEEREEEGWVAQVWKMKEC